MTTSRAAALCARRATTTRVGSATGSTAPRWAPRWHSDATHYLVPDATSIAEYVDFLEMRDAAKNIILLQSEARQVHRRGNTRLSKRLRDVYNDRRRSRAAVPERALRAHVRRRRA